MPSPVSANSDDTVDSPEISQVTEAPSFGDPVTFEFTAPAADQVRYGWQGHSRSTSDLDAEGKVRVELTPPSNSIDQVLQAEAVMASGDSSSTTELFVRVTKPSAPHSVGAWRLNGDGRDDSSVNNSIALDESIEFTSDRHGNAGLAASLSASGQSCMAPEDLSLDLSRSFAVGGWVKPDSGSDSAPTFIGQAGSASGSFNLTYAENDDKWAMTRSNADATDANIVSAVSETPVALGEWQHVVGVYDVAADSIRIYVNGVLEGSTVLDGDVWETNQPLTIGCLELSSGDRIGALEGVVDDIVAYQEALSSNQVSYLYHGGNFPAALLGDWEFRGSGDDVSGFSGPFSDMDSVTWGPDYWGRQDSAVEFAGSVCPNAELNTVKTNEPFSLSLKFRPNQLPGGEDPIIASVNGSNSSLAYFQYHGEKNEWQFKVRESDDRNAASSVISAPVDSSEGEWVQLSVSHDPYTKRTVLYVDGEEVSADAHMDFSSFEAETLSLGCGFDGTNAFPETAFGEVRLWQGIASTDDFTPAGTERTSYWGLSADESGSDGWADNNLTFEGGHDWVEDRFNECEAAYSPKAANESYAQTSSSVVTSDESFTMVAWAKLDDLNGDYTVVSETGEASSALGLKFDSELERWTFEMTDANDDPTVSAQAVSETAPNVDQWYHLTAVYNVATGEAQLYVDGALEETVDAMEHPWNTDGRLLVGASGDSAGDRWSFMNGTIDAVRAYSGTLDADTIQSLSDQRPIFPPPSMCGGDEDPW
ncbi:LamG domain-containing protein [Haloglycomyces albus]|uniref:LamG domain-containing protein n=1 Tax=Haloglycomyces albus TaxID=526067 RepID=UPI00046CDC83|nr:LamG domain-containing protein [Haloglycomyces albus]